MPKNTDTTEGRTLYNEPEQIVDIDRILKLIGRHKFRLSIIGAITFLGCLLVCYFFIPQSFTSQISLSFPQAAQPNAFAILTGTGGTGTRYVGVLRSRLFAEQAAKVAGVREACGFSSDEEAIDAVARGVGVNDNARDSLVYLTVTLPGPPRFGPGVAERRTRVKEATSKATNAYVGMLRDYMATSDTDRDAVLLRAANEQLEKARTDYEKTVSRLATYVTKPRRDVVPVASGDESGVSTSSGLGSSGSPAGRGDSRQVLSTTAAKELEALYVERGKLEAEIQSVTAGQSSGNKLRSAQVGSLNSLPEEDPLLASARAAVTTARLSRDALSTQLGPDHPEFRRAEERLKLAEANLKKQSKSILQHATTEDVSTQVMADSLRARIATVDNLIAKAETKAQRSLVFSQQYERRKNDVFLRLEVLKATASQAAVLSLQTISLKNRMSVVDMARPAKFGSPGTVAYVVISATATLLVLGIFILLASRSSGVTRREASPQVGLSGTDI